MLKRLIRIAVVAGIGVALITIGKSQAGRAGVGIALLAWLVLLGILFVMLPRAAHRAFEQGRFERARILYTIVRATVVDRDARGAIDVSLGGCWLARGDWDGALAHLGRIQPEQLAVSARAALWNNRAYAHARGLKDGPAALKAIDEAIRLRPDVAGFRHTRGLALLHMGRLEEAIAELEAVWQVTGEEEPLLEAERCFDLGVAWMQKGEREYARDYFRRARMIAPASPWATRAAEMITS